MKNLTKLLLTVSWLFGLLSIAAAIHPTQIQAGCADSVVCGCELGTGGTVPCRQVGSICTNEGVCSGQFCKPVEYSCQKCRCSFGDCETGVPGCWYYSVCTETRCCNLQPQSACTNSGINPTPTPAPGSTPGPGGGGSCDGVCVPAAANCGVYGYPGAGNGSCSGGQMCCQPYNQPPNSCNIYYIPPISLSPGESRQVTITVNAVTWGVDYIYFYDQNPYFTFSPSQFVGPEWCGRYLWPWPGTGTHTLTTTITANQVTPAGGVQTAAVAGWNGWSTPACSFNRCCNIGNCSTRYFTVTVLPPGPWWQAKDGDITTQGSLISLIPDSCTGACLARLILDGSGGFPGLAAYNGASYDFKAGIEQGEASSRGWLAQTGYGGRTYSYKQFASLIPSTTTLNTIAGDTILGGDLATGGTPTGDYVWYKRTGDLTINGDLTIAGGRKVVLFVEGGDVHFNGNVTVSSPGQGFFGIFVGKDAAGSKGNIIVDPTVTTLNGVFWNDSGFATGPGNTQLTVTGAVAGGGITLQRSLDAGNADTPAEFFVYDPTLAFTFPRELALDRIVWREVSP